MLPPTRENLLWEAARDGKDDEIERLIDAGTHVDCVNPDRVRSPHLISPHLPPPPPLLPHSSCSPQNGTTPLMTAARYANLSSVKLLLRCGADANMTSRWGRTALDDARKYTKQPRIADKRGVVAFLEDAGQVAAERAKGAAGKEAKVAIAAAGADDDPPFDFDCDLAPVADPKAAAALERWAAAARRRLHESFRAFVDELSRRRFLLCASSAHWRGWRRAAAVGRWRDAHCSSLQAKGMLPPSASSRLKRIGRSRNRTCFSLIAMSCIMTGAGMSISVLCETFPSGDTRT